MTYSRCRFRLVPILMALFLVVAGCDSNDDGGDDNNNGNPFGNGSVTATVDGNSFSAAIVVATFQSGVLGIGATKTVTGGTVQEQINIAIPNAAEGTYPVSLTNPVSIVYSTGSLAGATGYAGSSGSITIDELTDQGASGTFEFTGVNNAQETVTVTNGQFSVSFTN